VILIVVMSGVFAELAMKKTSIKTGSYEKSSPQIYTLITVTLYAGEISAICDGFGDSPSNITTPGPSLIFMAGQTVTVTLNNVGSMLHNWAIVSEKSSEAPVLWGAQIGSDSIPVNSGDSGSVTFTVGSAGSYYYICQIPGQVNIGMWGTIKVNP